MITNQQWVGFYTVLRREIMRMFRISSQVFLPPVITTLLYFLIFGAIIGSRVGRVEGIDYATFIAPGLVMMTVITNAYSNVSTSLFNARFQKNIEEILISPLHNTLLLLGYVLGGIVRGLIVGTLVFVVAIFFADLSLFDLPKVWLVLIPVSGVFALAGFTNALIARNFDDVALVPAFVLTPLTYLGGVFYATQMLPEPWRMISHINPILYMVNLLRHTMIGHEEVDISIAIFIIIITLVGLTALNLFCLKRGTGLRD